MAKMNKEIVEGYLKGTVSKDVYIDEYLRVCGVQPLRKSDEEIVKAASEGDSNSYVEYIKRENSKKRELVRKSREDLQEVTDEFNRIMSTMVRKEGQSQEQLANEVWMMKSSPLDELTLYDRYQIAMRDLLL